MLRHIFVALHSSHCSQSKAETSRSRAGFVGEDRGDARAALEFLIHAFDGVAAAHSQVDTCASLTSCFATRITGLI